MKSTLYIILAIAPVILNGALVWTLIIQRREQIRYNKQFKIHMEKMRQELDALKNYDL